MEGSRGEACVPDNAHFDHPWPSLGRPLPVFCSASCVVFSPNGRGCSSKVLAEINMHTSERCQDPCHTFLALLCGTHTC
eukprot:1690224-Pyramimonas_sp.AAC.1